MTRLPEIMVLGVGGTIAMTGEDGASVMPHLDARALVEAVPALADIASISVRTVAVIPGPHMDADTVMTIADAATGAIDAGANGVVITQGTDTIEESAFALDLLLRFDVPVVLTGAMRNPALPGADGPANLLAAVRTAAAPQACGQGVLVVMDEQVHAARFVSKIHTSSAAAFRSWPLLLGQITESQLAWFARVPRLPEIDFVAGRTLAPVALVTAVMGDDGRLLDAVTESGYAGVVIAGMGGGHVYPAMLSRLAFLAPRMPVVIASRTGGGSTLARTYAYEGGEIDLAARGVIPAGWLSPLKARIGLSLLLGGGATTAREFFTAFGGG